MCSCPPTLQGNAFVQCRKIEGMTTQLKQLRNENYIGTSILFPAPPQLTSPCHPNPCGANGQCRVQNSVAVCSCIPGYTGAPPLCRPECVQNSDCLSFQTCVNQKCINPCPGLCAFNAICRVTNNVARCVCAPGHTGDPWVQCHRVGKQHRSVNILNWIN